MAVIALHARLFPALADRVWAEVNLDTEARKRAPADAYPHNPLLDPQTGWAFVEAIAADAGADFTYGGYLEDRVHLLRDTYLDESGRRHLGIDYNAPAGTAVHMPVDGELLEAWPDPDLDGGWGGRLLFRAPGSEVYFVLGHLAHAPVTALQEKIGAVIAAGEAVGVIGQPAENGYWFPHLHVQCVSADEPRPVEGALDGYATWSEALRTRYPDPQLALG